MDLLADARMNIASEAEDALLLERDRLLADNAKLNMTKEAVAFDNARLSAENKLLKAANEQLQVRKEHDLGSLHKRVKRLESKLG